MIHIAIVTRLLDEFIRKFDGLWHANLLLRHYVAKSGKMQHKYNLRSDKILVVQFVLEDFTVTRIRF
jgi:hypothetical protein